MSKAAKIDFSKFPSVICLKSRRIKRDRKIQAPTIERKKSAEELLQELEDMLHELERTIDE